MKQVLRIGRKEALAKSSHYRRMERFGIGPSRPRQRPIAQPTPVPKPLQSAVKNNVGPTEGFFGRKAAPKVAVARLQPAPRTLRPLVLVDGPVANRVAPVKPSATTSPAYRAPPVSLPDEDDDASDYGEENADDDEVPLARQARIRKDLNIGSHFSDSSFGSGGLVTSGSDSTLSTISSITPSSSVGSLTDSLSGVSLSMASLASSLRSEEARLVHNIPCIPLKGKTPMA